MNEGKDRGLWWHTASIESTLANTVRDKKRKSRPWKTADFHPWEERDRREKAEKAGRKNFADITILKAVFVDQMDFSEIEDDFGI